MAVSVHVFSPAGIVGVLHAKSVGRSAAQLSLGVSVGGLVVSVPVSFAGPVSVATSEVPVSVSVTAGVLSLLPQPTKEAALKTAPPKTRVTKEKAWEVFMGF